VGILFAACLIGCTPPSQKEKPGDDAKKPEDQVKQAFASLQAAIKAKDADKIWDLLDKDSQSDAEREAKAASKAHSQLADKDKVDYEKRLDLTGKELAGMNGKLCVKSDVFYGKHHEVPDSKIDKVSVDGETGTLYYIEDDGDKGNFPLVREKGQWRFSLVIPKAPEK
jgi:hypothetical protein